MASKKDKKKGGKNSDNRQAGKTIESQGKETISFAPCSNGDKEKVGDRVALTATEITDRGLQGNEEEKTAPRFNAFQRLLIKLGGIKVPDEPDLEAEVAQKKKIEDLEQKIANLDKQLYNYEVAINDCILKLEPNYYKTTVERSHLSNTLIREVDNLRKLADERLADLGKLQKDALTASEESEAGIVEYRISDTVSDSARNTDVVTNVTIDDLVKTNDFEAFKKKELEEKHRLRGEKNELQKRYDRLKGDFSIKESRIKSLEEELGRRKKEVDKLSVQLEQAKRSLNDEILSLNMTIEENEKTIKEKSDKISQMVETERRASEVLKKVQEDNKQLRASDIGEMTTKLEEAQDEIDTLKGIVSGHEVTIKVKNNEINGLNSTIESKAGAYEALTKAKMDVEVKLKAIESELGQVRQEINTANSTISRQTKEIERTAKIIEDKNKLIEDKISKIKDLDGKLNVTISALNDARKEIEHQKGIVLTRDHEIVGLNDRIDDLSANLANIEIVLNNSKKTASKSVEDFYEAIIEQAEAALNILNAGQYELGQGEMGETCADDEDMNKRRFSKLVARLKGITPADYKTVADLRVALLDVLSEEVNKEAEGIITPLARLCAYSRLPFMRDDQGEDYMVLDTKRLSRLEQHLKGMLALVGIELIIPTPFCDTVNEGDFESRLGEIPNLDYICPNARQHLDKVDRLNTEDVITDIVCVGYRIPGQVDQKAKVIL